MGDIARQASTSSLEKVDKRELIYTGRSSDKLDAYEEVKTLGRGAFGVATLVRSRDGSSFRVIKQIDLSVLSPAALEESHKEVGVLRQLTHRHIVAYYDTFVKSNSLYIVMEYADGGDLASLIRQHKDSETPFTEAEAMTIFGQCLLALQYIHSKHILHRDIKSQNIFMMQAGAKEVGDAKIGDFGISKVIEGTTAAQGTVVGTPSYFAPEICQDEPYNSKIDIWSMGVVLYEMLALAQPFTASNVAALIMKIVSAEPAPLPSSCRPEVCDVVQRALNKKAEDRASAEELLALPPVSAVVQDEQTKSLSMSNFEKIETLGRGAHGVATLVKQKSDGAMRVVKSVDFSRMSDEAQKGAKDEVALLRRLAHPHIIAYYDAFFEADQLNIVLEYADAGDLFTAVKRRREEDAFFTDEEAMHWFRQCLSALCFIHKRKVLHRDIKTQNIFLMASGDAKLGDFGISKVMDGTMAEAGTVVGTPAYLAPEICQNVPYGSRIDVWSLGTVLYELLSLRHPFQSSNMAATVLKIISSEPAPLPSRCGEEVVQIVQLCLQKDPAKRPSAKELLANPAIKSFGEETARLDATDSDLGSTWGGHVVEEGEGSTTFNGGLTRQYTGEFLIADPDGDRSLKGILEANLEDGDTTASLSLTSPGAATASVIAALEESLQGSSTLVIPKQGEEKDPNQRTVQLGELDKTFRTQQEAAEEKINEKREKALAEAAAFQEEQRRWLAAMQEEVQAKHVEAEQADSDNRTLSKTRRRGKESKDSARESPESAREGPPEGARREWREDDELSPQQRIRKAKEEKAAEGFRAHQEAMALNAQDKQKAHERRLMDQRGTVDIFSGEPKKRPEETLARTQVSRPSSKEKGDAGSLRGAGSAIAASASSAGLRPGSGSSEKAPREGTRVSPAGRTKRPGDERGMNDAVRVREQTIWVKPS